MFDEPGQHDDFAGEDQVWIPRAEVTAVLRDHAAPVGLDVGDVELLDWTAGLDGEMCGGDAPEVVAGSDRVRSDDRGRRRWHRRGRNDGRDWIGRRGVVRGIASRHCRRRRITRCSGPVDGSTASNVAGSMRLVGGRPRGLSLLDVPLEMNDRPAVRDRGG